MPATRTTTTRTTTTTLALTLLPLTLTGCGAAHPTGAPRQATFGLASPTPTPAGSPGPDPSPMPGVRGAWTSTADLPRPVTDGTVIAGLTSRNDRVQALDPATGRQLWDVPVPLTGGATPSSEVGVAGPVLLAAPGAPLVLNLTTTVPGSGLTPASTGPVATALDPANGRVLWSAPGPATYVDGAAVLTGSSDQDTDGSSVTALDPATGKTRWTRPGAAVGLGGGVAVLSAKGDGGLSTVLTGTDTATGKALWSSTDWARGAQGSRSTLVATGAGHALIETTRSDLAGDTTSLLVRDLRTGRTVGPEVPQPANPVALADTATGVAVVYEQVPDGAATGPTGVDMRTGRVLWHLTVAQSAKAEVAGGGLVWVDGADGYVAVDDRTGKARAQGLDSVPLLALPGEQVQASNTGLVAQPLPG